MEPNIPTQPAQPELSVVQQIENPQTTSSIPPKKIKKIFFIIAIILLLMLLAILGFIGYHSFFNKSVTTVASPSKQKTTPTVIPTKTPTSTITPSPTASSSAINTSNWNTYNNTEGVSKYGQSYAFSIQYPNNWHTLTDLQGAGVDLSDDSNYYTADLQNGTQRNHTHIMIIVAPALAASLCKSVPFTNSDNVTPNPTQHAITINGISGLEGKTYANKGDTNYDSEHILLNNPLGGCVNITYTIDNVSGSEQLFNAVANTFKF